MHTGYLTVETHAGHSGLSRVNLYSALPDPEPTGDTQPRIRYIAHFNDGDAARMHAHEVLKRHLIDLEAHLYRVSAECAVAAIEASDLRHRRVYLDPAFSDDSKLSIDELSARFRNQCRRRDHFFQTVGYIGIALLLFNLIALSLV